MTSIIQLILTLFLPLSNSLFSLNKSKTRIRKGVTAMKMLSLKMMSSPKYPRPTVLKMPWIMTQQVHLNS